MSQELKQSVSEELSEKLYSELRKMGRISKRPNMNTWYKAITRLVTKPNGREVIEWTIDHLRDPHLPRIFSPATLTSKFERLSKLWSDVAGEMHPKTKAVWASVEHLIWPTSDEEVRRSINRTLRAMQSFRLHLFKGTPMSTRELLVADYLLEALSPIDDAAHLWYAQVWRRIQDWQEFSGSLEFFEFNSTRTYTRDWMRRVTMPLGAGTDDLLYLFEVSR